MSDMRDAPAYLKHGIVGAAGSMGWALQALLSRGQKVVCVDSSHPEMHWEDARDQLRACDVIWLSMPRMALKDVLEELGPLQRSQLVVDVFSVKTKDTEELIARAGASHLSLHPMHGPNIRSSRQKWFLIGPRADRVGHAETVLRLLEEHGITFLEVESSRMHDSIMGLVLGLKELLTLVIDRMLSAYAGACKMREPGMDELMVWASPVANAIYGAYVHSVMSSEDWLRVSLVMDPPEDVSQATVDALRTLAAELEAIMNDRENAPQSLRRLFEEQRGRVTSTVAPAHQGDISDYVNGWFEDSTGYVSRSLRATSVRRQG